MTATQSMVTEEQQSARVGAASGCEVSSQQEDSRALQDAYALARSTWREVALSYERFYAHAAGLGYTGCVVPAHPADLYLCAACEQGESVAYQTLEATYFPTLLRVICRILGDKAAAEEVLQEIRTRLFVGRAPRIAGYRGSGPLAGWLRTLAVHAAQDRLRATNVQRGRLRKLASAQRTVLGTETLEEADETAFRREYARVCSRAWSAAIGSLAAQERRLLHHHFVSGLSIDTLGPIYRVHRATIHRRIRRATERVRCQVRQVLARHYWDLTHRDLDALAFRACCDLDLGAALVRETVDPSHAA
jgi:RNA polymerase sigma-70 factor (ECF subfamily)